MDKQQPRQPEGIPAGGQYAHKRHGTPDVAIGFASRAEVLERAGYVPATVMPSASDPRSATRAKEWWARARISAEYGGKYPQMQDLVDGTVQRRAYGNDRIKLRMPAVSAIRACAAENPGTFDVPVSMSLGGAKPVQGWVRVTPGPEGTWHVKTLGGEGDAANELAEAVTAVLEARRPTQALPKIQNLLERRRERLATAGTQLREVSSSFLQEVGYDPNTRTLATRIGGKLYGHAVSRELFQRLGNSENPGQAFNRLVRKQADRVDVTQCPECSRIHPTAARHVCPPPERLTPAGYPRREVRDEAIRDSRERAGLPVSRPAKRPPAARPAPGAPHNPPPASELFHLSALERMRILSGGEF